LSVHVTCERVQMYLPLTHSGCDMFHEPPDCVELLVDR
jgi:hypothetical protein